MSANSGQLYAVRAVLKPVHVPRYDRFFFSTEWEEKDKEGKHLISDLPLENFVSSPAPIFEFGKKWRELCLNPGKSVKRALRHRAGANEYIPNGNEFVRKVYNSYSVVLRGNAQEFYCVSFWGHDKPRDVRLKFMEFYFPRELLMFWIKNERAGPRFRK